MIEIWKTCIEFPDYEVSDLGRVRSYQYGKPPRILKPKRTQRGYLSLTLCRHGNRKDKTVHRIVAETFLPNSEQKMEVDHINGVKTDNRVINLRWATRSENENNEITKARHSKIRFWQGKTGAAHNQARPVICVELARRFDTAKEAQDSLGVLRSHICQVCKGKRKTAGGYHWIYANKGEANEPQ